MNVSGHRKAELAAVMERLLRKKEVADLLACSTRTIDRLVAAGRLTAIRLVGGVRYRLSEVQAMMNGSAS